MRLTDHFTLDELTASQTAARQGIDNTPPADVVEALRAAAHVLESVRIVLGGKAIAVSSGYRSPALNRLVGGSPGSDHVRGLAIDFNCYGFGWPLQICEAIARSGVQYDQLIHEFGRWVHLGVGPRMRQQNLTIDRLGTRAGLLSVR